MRSTLAMSSKKVLLIIIDALSSEYTVPAIRRGALPNLGKLAQVGQLREESVSVFPSLTPVATSSLATGKYPGDHGVLGFHWYDRESGDEAYHGDDFWVVTKLGFGHFFQSCLQTLNRERLRTKTVFQLLAANRRTSCSLNYLIYKGDREHQASVPAWFNWHPEVPGIQSLLGPDVLFFGDIVSSEFALEEDAPQRKGGAFGRFGFNDENTGRLLEELPFFNPRPDFTIAYFPDHDYDAHKVGLAGALSKVEAVDAVLGRVLDQLGGMERALQDFTILVTGDHSQSDMHSDETEASIRLDLLFGAEVVSPPGDWKDKSKLKVCPDMRCAQIAYTDEFSLSPETLVEMLLNEPRIDQVIEPSPKADFDFQVRTADRGALLFSLDPSSPFRDAHGNRWRWKGGLSAVDASMEGELITYGDYPNALERIARAFNGNVQEIWATARVGHEFALKETSVHVGGGSHGSLHRLDSLSPLLAAGLPEGIDLPEHPRAVDVTPLCMKILE